MQFDYMCRVVVDASVDIPDIGNFCLSAYNDMGEMYILMAKTSLGWTEMVEAGPYINGSDDLPKYFSTTYKRIEYKSTTIEKIIDKFLNSPNRIITQAMVVDYDYIVEHTHSKDLIEVMGQ